MGMITEVGGNVLLLTGVMRVVCRVARVTADNVVGAPVALRHEQGTDREAKEVVGPPLAFEEYVAHLGCFR